MSDIEAAARRRATERLIAGGAIVSKTTGKLVRLSASARTLVDRCTRRWWFEKIAGRKREETAAMGFGSSVHTVCEDHLLGNDQPPSTWETRAGRVARPGIEGVGDDGRPLLPAPGTVHVEQQVGGMCGPLTFSGKVDFSPNCENDYFPDERVEGAYIGDHKTTSDPRWAKTSDELARDPQTHAYAWKLWGPSGLDAGFSRDRLVGLVHIYYLTKGRPRAFRVDAVARWGDIESTWLNTYLPAAIRMAALAEVEDSDEVPANPGDCRSFYRLCPHAGVCSSSPSGIQRRAASLIGLS